MAADGEASRPSRSRSARTSAWWTGAHMPFRGDCTGAHKAPRDAGSGSRSPHQWRPQWLALETGNDSLASGQASPLGKKEGATRPNDPPSHFSMEIPGQFRVEINMLEPVPLAVSLLWKLLQLWSKSWSLATQEA